MVFSTQAKIEKAQKVKGILNVFGVYDHTDDTMFTHCYKNKTSDQFIDFIKELILDMIPRSKQYSLFWIMHPYIGQKRQ